MSERFSEEPGFRYLDPTLAGLIDGVPGPLVDYSTQTFTCSNADCGRSPGIPANLRTDSCWLTRFSGRFNQPDDSITIRGDAFGNASIGGFTDGNKSVLGTMMCTAGGNPTVFEVSLSKGEESPKRVPLPEQGVGRACYLMGITGNMNNAHVVSADLVNGQWVATLKSNFGNDSGLTAKFGCTDGTIVDQRTDIRIGDDLVFLSPQDPGIACALRGVASDFHSIGEEANVTCLIDPATKVCEQTGRGYWIGEVTSNRTDFDAHPRASTICWQR